MTVLTSEKAPVAFALLPTDTERFSLEMPKTSININR